MKQFIPASYIFSYWIFVWSSVYILSVWFIRNPPQMIQWFNPTFALLIAFIGTFESLIGLYLQGFSWNILLKYAATIVGIKAIPLFFIYRLGMPFGWNIHTLRDLGVIFGMFVLYMVYLWINGTTYEAVYSDLTESIENDENRTPFEWIVNRIFGI